MQFHLTVLFNGCKADEVDSVAGEPRWWHGRARPDPEPAQLPGVYLRQLEGRIPVELDARVA